MAVAIATASMTGSVRAKSPVMSTTLASEVSGARAPAGLTGGFTPPPAYAAATA